MSPQNASNACFCGCGRNLKRGDRVFSASGADALDIVNALGRVSLSLVEGDTGRREAVQGAADDGRQLVDLFQRLSHREVRPPSRAQGQDLARRFLAWKNTAEAITRSHAP